MAYHDNKGVFYGEATLWTVRINNLRYTTSNTITYDCKLNDNSLRVLGGFEAMQDIYDYFEVKSLKVDPAIPYPTTLAPAVKICEG